MIEKTDELSPFMWHVIRVDTEKHRLPLYGRLIALSEQFLTIERRDGRLTLIRRDAVVGIEPTAKQ